MQQKLPMSDFWLDIGECGLVAGEISKVGRKEEGTLRRATEFLDD